MILKLEERIRYKRALIFYMVRFVFIMVKWVTMNDDVCINSRGVAHRTHPILPSLSNNQLLNYCCSQESSLRHCTIISSLFDPLLFIRPTRHLGWKVTALDVLKLFSYKIPMSSSSLLRYGIKHFWVPEFTISVVLCRYQTGSVSYGRYRNKNDRTICVFPSFVLPLNHNNR